MRVCLRVRPLSTHEKAQNCSTVITYPFKDVVQIGSDRSFTFDYVKSERAPQVSLVTTPVLNDTSSSTSCLRAPHAFWIINACSSHLFSQSTYFSILSNSLMSMMSVSPVSYRPSWTDTMRPLSPTGKQEGMSLSTRLLSISMPVTISNDEPFPLHVGLCGDAIKSFRRASY